MQKVFSEKESIKYQVFPDLPDLNGNSYSKDELKSKAKEGLPAPAIMSDKNEHELMRGFITDREFIEENNKYYYLASVIWVFDAISKYVVDRDMNGKTAKSIEDMNKYKTWLITIPEEGNNI